METIEIVNLISCIVILSTSLYMLFVHFGSSRSQLDKHLKKVEYFLVKIGLVFMAMGTLFLIIKLEKEPLGQVILNVGLAFFMFWNSIRLNRMFIYKKIKDNEIINENISTRTVDPKGQDFPEDQENP